MTKMLSIVLSFVPAIAFAGGGEVMETKSPSPWMWVGFAGFVILMLVVVLGSSLRKHAAEIDGQTNKEGSK